MSRGVAGLEGCMPRAAPSHPRRRRLDEQLRQRRGWRRRRGRLGTAAATPARLKSRFGADKCGLAQPRVDLVVPRAQPQGELGAASRIHRRRREHAAKVRRAIVTGVHAAQRGKKGLHGRALGGSRRLWVRRCHLVKQRPAGAAELRASHRKRGGGRSGSGRGRKDGRAAEEQVHSRGACERQAERARTALQLLTFSSCHHQRDKHSSLQAQYRTAGDDL